MNYKVTDAQLSGIADAIRTKGGTSAQLVFPSGFVSAISAISVGGANLGSISISENGTYTPTGGLDGFDNVVVDVQGGITPSGSINISQNGTYDVSSFAEAVVNVPQSGGGDADLMANIFLGVSDGSVHNSYVSGTLRSYALEKTKVTDVSFPNISYISTRAFASCQNLSKVHLENCTSVEQHAFAYCTSLEELSVPELKTANGSAFVGCGLSIVNFPKLETIGSNAFGYCYSLETVNLPMIKVISASAFIECSSLKTVVLGSLAQEIGISAFSKCIALESFYVFATSAFNINSYVFNYTPINVESYLGHFGSIYVLESMVDAFKSAPGWSYFSDRITSYTE